MSDLASRAQELADAVAQVVCERFCHPTSTYRLQFEPARWAFAMRRQLFPT